jgi:hypothetical protein
MAEVDAMPIARIDPITILFMMISPRMGMRLLQASCKELADLSCKTMRALFEMSAA